MDGRPSPRNRRVGLFGWLALGYLLLVAVVVVLEVGVDVVAIDLFRDPLELGGPADTHPWKGSLSVIGVFCWSAAAAVSFLAGRVLRSTGADPERARFLVATGALLLILGVDDGLLVHDHWAERITGWDESQPLTSAALFGLVALWLVFFRREIANTRYLVLWLALGGFVVAEIIDLGGEFDIRSDAANLTEEVLELGAVATMLVYAAGEAWRTLVSHAPSTTHLPS